jgi:hypothetical protein
LSQFAIDLGVSVKAKNDAVTSGPDWVGPINDTVGKVVAFFTKSEQHSEWREFKPNPSISGPKKTGPPVKKIKVREMNNEK